MTQMSFSTTRVLISLSEFLAENGDYTFLCVDKGVLGAIRMLIRSYGMRRANWVEAYTDIGYETPSEANWDIIDAKISEFLEETNMTTCSDLIDAINRLADSNCFGCGPGSGGAGGSPAGANPFDDTGWDVPVGFSGLPEYKLYKCKAANLAFDKVKSDMTYLLGGTITTITATILVGTLLSPIPFDEVFGLAAFLVGLLLQAVLASTASGIITELNTYQEEFVCAIYSASDAEAALLALEAWASGTASFTATEAAMFNYWLTIEAVNPAFEKNGIVESQTPVSSIDCLDCEAPPDCPALGLYLSISDIYWFEPVVGETYPLNPFYSGGYWRVAIGNHPPMAGCTCTEFMATLTGDLSDAYGSSTQLCNGTYEHVNNLSSISGISTQMAELGNINNTSGVVYFKFDGWV